MLRPAILYKDEIIRKSQELFYTEDMLLYNGYLNNQQINIIDGDDNGNIFQYAIVNKEEKLVGYISFTMDWYSSCAYAFGLISFDKGNINIGLAINEILNKVIKEFKVHRIEYRMIGDNPVKKHYDKFCKKYNGRIIELKDCFKDRQGKYRNEYIYEILF